MPLFRLLLAAVGASGREGDGLMRRLVLMFINPNARRVQASRQLCAPVQHGALRQSEMRPRHD